MRLIKGLKRKRVGSDPALALLPWESLAAPGAAVSAVTSRRQRLTEST